MKYVISLITLSSLLLWVGAGFPVSIKQTTDTSGTEVRVCKNIFGKKEVSIGNPLLAHTVLTDKNSDGMVDFKVYEIPSRWGYFVATSMVTKEDQQKFTLFTQ